MCCLIKRILAAFLAASLLIISLAACNKNAAKDTEDGSSSVTDITSVLSGAENSAPYDDNHDSSIFAESGNSEESDYSIFSEDSHASAEHSESVESSNAGISVSSGDSQASSEAESHETPSSSAETGDSSSEPTDDSSSEPADDSSSKPVDDSSSKLADDSSSEPTDDSSSKPVDDSSSKPADDCSSESVDDSSSESVDDSSEDSSEEEPAYPMDPLNPLPETLYTDPIDSFFDGSVFVGYSIMMHFGRYVSEWKSEIDSSIMGNAVFCAGVGISFYVDRTQSASDRGTSLPTYRGNAYNFKDLPSATGSDAIYIGLMGYSDLKRSSSSSNCVQYAYNETIEGLKRIKDANPSVRIVVLANTYNTGNYSGLSHSRQSNAKVLEYNNLVLDYCTANGIDFVDVATPLTDHRGYFVEEYSSDGEYHIIKEAYYIWVQVLRDYATRKQNGTWQNLTDMPVLPYLA